LIKGIKWDIKSCDLRRLPIDFLSIYTKIGGQMVFTLSLNIYEPDD